MSGIKSIIAGISVTLLLIGFFLKLSPHGKMSKGLQHVLSMVVLLIIITPLSGGFELDLKGWNFDNNEIEINSENNYENRVVSNVVTIMIRDIEEYLISENYGFYSVNISTLSRDGETEFNEIIIHIKSGYAPDKIERAISRKFGLPTKVIIGKE